MAWLSYEIPFEVSATAAVDLVEIQPADDVPCVITDIDVKVTSEIAEAQEEWVEIEIHRGGTGITSGSGGTTLGSATPDTGKMPASATQVEANNTTIATFTGGGAIWRSAFQVRAGGEWHFPPEAWKGATQANGGMVVRLPNAAADSIDIKGTVTILEWV